MLQKNCKAFSYQFRVKKLFAMILSKNATFGMNYETNMNGFTRMHACYGDALPKNVYFYWHTYSYHQNWYKHFFFFGKIARFAPPLNKRQEKYYALYACVTHLSPIIRIGASYDVCNAFGRIEDACRLRWCIDNALLMHQMRH